MAVSVDEKYKSKLRSIYKIRAKKPLDVQYTDTGDLMVFDKTIKGGSLKVTLNEYRPITNEERESQEALRYERIRDAEAIYEQRRQAYREKIVEYHQEKAAGGQVGSVLEIVNLSKELAALDLALQTSRFAERNVALYGSVPTNRMIFDDPKNERMMKDVTAFIASPFDVASTYVRLARAPRAGEEGGAGAGAGAGAGGRRLKAKEAPPPVLVVQPGTTYEFLNPWAPISVKYKDAVYPSVYVALMATLARQFNDEEAFARIVAAPTPEAAIYKRKETIDEEEWNRAFGKNLMLITRAKFRENPLLGEKLMQTGNARIAIIPLENPLDMLLGTGIAPDSPAIRNPDKWAGQNLYGRAVELLRADLIQKREAALAAGGPAAGGAGAGAGAGGAVEAAGAAVVSAITGIADVAASAAQTAAGAGAGAVAGAAQTAAGVAEGVVEAVTAATGGQPAL